MQTFVAYYVSEHGTQRSNTMFVGEVNKDVNTCLINIFTAIQLCEAIFTGNPSIIVDSGVSIGQLCTTVFLEMSIKF